MDVYAWASHADHCFPEAIIKYGFVTQPVITAASGHSISFWGRRREQMTALFGGVLLWKLTSTKGNLFLCLTSCTRHHATSTNGETYVMHSSVHELWPTVLASGQELCKSFASRRPGSIHVGFVVDSGTGTGFSPEFFGFPVSISFHRCSPNSYLENA
jgi:hypothetical protein